MEFFKQWTMCVCVTLVIASLFSLLAPKGRMKGFYKIILSVFVFVSFIYPLKDFKANDININYDSSFQNISDSRVTVCENEVNSQVKALLENCGITGATVISNLSFKSENEISIDFVQISIPDEYDKKAVEKIVFDGLGIKAKVIYTGE